YGGRTSAHIRKVSVPVVCTDFLSMYPTVNRLMDLWSFVRARQIRVVERCRSQVDDFLQTVSLETMFRPETWHQLMAFVRLIPDGDVLPTRGQYGESHDWQVAVNHVYGKRNSRSHALWYALPDVAASVLLNGRVPKILDA